MYSILQNLLLLYMLDPDRDYTCVSNSGKDFGKVARIVCQEQPAGESEHFTCCDRESGQDG